MKTLLFSLILGSCVSLSLTAQTTSPPDTQQIMVDVVFLSSDLLEGRLTATAGEQLAAQYIAQRMSTIGLRPQPGYEHFLQPFNFEIKANPHGGAAMDKTGFNVAGFLDRGAEKTIIIGAHYDHLGYGGIGSLHAGKPAVHNGADDNASGIAALLRTAEKLQQSNQYRGNNFLFIAFSGEELGLVGSKKWVEAHPDFPANAMFNMDMVGRLRQKRHQLAVFGTGTSPLWDKALDAAEEKSVITTVRDSSGIGPSDHTSFYLDSIPVIALFTGQHEQYHKPEDDARLVDFGGVARVSDFLLHLIQAIDGEGALPFLTTKQKAQREAANFKVTLGVMPDYIHAGEGMKIDGVTEGRPAALAGIKAGDVLIKIGELDVKDIYDYMEGLSRHQKGDTVEVVVRRGEELLTRSVTF